MSQNETKLIEILKLAMQKEASDVHLKAGIMPVIRRHGVLRPLSAQSAALTGEEIDGIARSIVDDRQWNYFLENKEVDVGYGVSGLGRFRINIFRQRGTTRLVIRNIPHSIPQFSDLALPPQIADICKYERGLVLVTGVTGAGKSSTLAAMIDFINRNKNKHILTIEDPIEFLIRDRKSIVTQRELGVDSLNFTQALRAALRQDPDVILIGEMRDRETIEIALLAAETGHLVLSTLHTIDSGETINRIIAAFPADQQGQIRVQLGSVLRAVISQRLTRRVDGKGFVPAVEVLVNNPRVREMIEDPHQTKAIKTAIEEGRSAWGMQSFDQSLMDLVSAGLISFDEALIQTSSPEDFRVRYEGVQSMDGKKFADSSDVDRRLENDWHGLSEVEIETPTEIKIVRGKKGK